MKKLNKEFKKLIKHYYKKKPSKKKMLILKNFFLGGIVMGIGRKTNER